MARKTKAEIVAENAAEEAEYQKQRIARIKERKTFKAEQIPVEARPKEPQGYKSLSQQSVEFDANIIEFESQTKDILTVKVKIVDGKELPKEIAKGLMDFLGDTYGEIALWKVNDLVLMKNIYDAINKKNW